MSKSEKELVLALSKMPKDDRNKFLENNPKIIKWLEKTFKSKLRTREVEKTSDKALENAIYSSYAAKAYQADGNKAKKLEYYIKKDEYIKRKVDIDCLIHDNTKKSKTGVARAPQKDRHGGFMAYILGDSKGEHPGLHTKMTLPEINSDNIGTVVSKNNAEYLGYNNPQELKVAAKKRAEAGLLESNWELFANSLDLNESEFMDDFKAIYGKFEPLEEGLSIKLNVADCKNVFNLSLAKIMKYSDSEIKADIKDKDNGKDIKDYKVNNGDTGLTLNYMLAYIKRLGKSKEKDFLDRKLDYFMKIQDRARDKGVASGISFSAVNAVYKKYLKYKRK